MRIASLRIRRLSYQIEDYLYFAGYLLYCGNNIIWILGQSHTLTHVCASSDKTKAIFIADIGKDITDVNANSLRNYYRLQLACQIMYAATLGFIKPSVIALLLRVFASTCGWLRIWGHATICIAVMWPLYTSLLGLVSDAL